MVSSSYMSLATEDQREQYKDWDSIVRVWGYDWTPHEVQTEDGYTLSLF